MPALQGPDVTSCKKLHDQTRAQNEKEGLVYCFPLEKQVHTAEEGDMSPHLNDLFPKKY